MSRIRGFETLLVGDTTLRIHVIVGDRFALLVDTAMRGFENLVDEALAYIKSAEVPLGFIVNTHAHHDHMGLNGYARATTGARIAAHPWGKRWIEDPDINYQEFVLPYPDLIPDGPELREEIRFTMGDPTCVDITVSGGEHFYPGAVDVEVVDTSGHLPGEIGLLVTEERTLIVGDVLIGLDLPMFHGYTHPDRYRCTLRNIRELVTSGRVTRVVTSHLPELLGADAILEAVEAREQDVTEIERLILETVQASPKTLKEVWVVISNAKGKRPEFRGLQMIANHLQWLHATGHIAFDGITRVPGVYRTKMLGDHLAKDLPETAAT